MNAAAAPAPSAKAAAPLPANVVTAPVATFDYMGTLTTDGTTIWIGHQQTIRAVDIATGAVTTIAGVRLLGRLFAEVIALRSCDRPESQVRERIPEARILDPRPCERRPFADGVVV